MHHCAAKNDGESQAATPLKYFCERNKRPRGRQIADGEKYEKRIEKRGKKNCDRHAGGGRKVTIKLLPTRRLLCLVLNDTLQAKRVVPH